MPSNLDYRRIFDEYDRHPKDGFLNISELQRIIKDHDNYNDDIPPQAVHRIMKMSDQNGDGKIDFDEFVTMIKNPELSYLFGKYMTRYINFVLPPIERRPVKGIQLRSLRGTEEYIDETDSSYESAYSCYPPAIIMIICSLIEIITFAVDEIRTPGSTQFGTGEIAKTLMFDPYKRNEIWRFLTYMFVHIGYFHLIVNVCVQLALGLPLEMVHKWRVLPVYLLGVIAGSLLTSIVDSVYLAGASGGVYAIITAHVASIIMNWSEMQLPFVQLAIFLLVLGSDFGSAIYNRYCGVGDNKIGYEAHLAGALAGAIVGIYMLKNLKQRKFENYLWWAAVAFSAIAIAVMIIINIFVI